MYRIDKSPRGKKLEQGDLVWVQSLRKSKHHSNSPESVLREGVGTIIRKNIYNNTYMVVMDGDERSDALTRTQKELKLLQPYEENK